MPNFCTARFRFLPASGRARSARWYGRAPGVRSIAALPTFAHGPALRMRRPPSRMHRPPHSPRMPDAASKPRLCGPQQGRCKKVLRFTGAPCRQCVRLHPHARQLQVGFSLPGPPSTSPPFEAVLHSCRTPPWGMRAPADCRRCLRSTCWSLPKTRL